MQSYHTEGQETSNKRTEQEKDHDQILVTAAVDENGEGRIRATTTTAVVPRTYLFTGWTDGRIPLTFAATLSIKNDDYEKGMGGG